MNFEGAECVGEISGNLFFFFFLFSDNIAVVAVGPQAAYW